MRTIFIFMALGFLIGCQSSSTQNAPVATPVEKANASKNVTKEPSKETQKSQNFEDEDISKSKPKMPVEQSSIEMGQITCVYGNDTRIIETTSGEGKACIVNYTKNNETTMKASGIIDTSKCVEVRDRIRSNLENAGFKCQ